MQHCESFRIGYIVKRYPRYSETFIVNEILSHEEAGLELDIFSLYPSVDSHFQDSLSLVRAPVTYLTVAGRKFSHFWWGLEEAAESMNDLWLCLESAKGENPSDVYQAAQIALQVKMRGIHHLHAHFASSAASVARLASLFSGVPYSFTSHAKDIYHESVQPEDLMRKMHDAAVVVTVSDYNRDYLISKYGTAAEKIKRVYNGINLTRFHYKSPWDRPAKIVFVGRLVEKKGVPDLLEACRILNQRGCLFECTVIGDGDLRNELQVLSHHLGLADSVRFLGSRPQKEIVTFVQEAAVIAAPCIVGADGNRDGLPTVLLEAMALGTPCVSTDVTGIPEAIRHGKSGLIVPQSNPSVLAAALENILFNPGLRVALAEGARAVIEKDFDIRKNTEYLRGVIMAGHNVSMSASGDVF